ncbi:cytochrome b/b6 domain-containing protein [Catenovulum sediminis]|uniref:Cytochrome b/b6 domain-containing protein n=1 Tax=Catenovulum sediminis TaxID=1740262 RepID=A0ABV1RLG3_9ALTE|nr:cytochrome b/b6 domain-containing protein [Catenovulum sediminis]
MKTVKVWDFWIRAFHWLLLAGFTGAWLTIEYGWMQAHAVIGYCLSVLLIFRVLWGFWGSTTAHFTAFLCSPITALKYLKNSLQLKAPAHAGHNPAGGWMVVCMLALLFWQIISGLLANNDLGFSGPFADFINKTLSDQLTQWHGWNFYIILSAVWLHLVAVFFYQLVKREKLVQAMFSGKKPNIQAPNWQSLNFKSNIRAISLLVFSALIVCIIVFL